MGALHLGVPLITGKEKPAENQRVSNSWSGERGSTTHHFTEYQNIANPRKTWILGFLVICYCVTKYHFSGQIRVQNRVQ